MASHSWYYYVATGLTHDHNPIVLVVVTKRQGLSICDWLDKSTINVNPVSGASNSIDFHQLEKPLDLLL